MFILHQKVILPDTHGNKEGTITLVPKQITPQEGLAQQVKRVKVSYITGKGGLSEAWFPTTGDKAITPYISAKDITDQLEAKHQEEMEKVNAIHDRQKLDWITDKEAREFSITRVQDVEESGQALTNGEILEPKADTNIVDELAVINAKRGKPQSNDNDNSDSFIG